MNTKFLRDSSRKYSFDSIAYIYDDTRHLHPGLQSDLIRELKLLSLSSNQLFEVGIGTGRISADLFKFGISVAGLDLSFEMLKIARLKGLTCIHADAEAIPFSDKSFDVVFSFDVIQLIPHWVRAIREMQRITRKHIAFIDVKIETRFIGEGKFTTVPSQYMKTLNRNGVTILPAPGVLPSDLVRVINPDKIISCGPYYDYPSNAQLMHPFIAKSFIFQESVENDLHSLAMGDISRFYNSSQVERRWLLYIYIWKPSSFDYILQKSEISASPRIIISKDLQMEADDRSDLLKYLRCPNSGEKLKIMSGDRVALICKNVSRLYDTNLESRFAIWKLNVAQVFTNEAETYAYPVVDGIVSFISGVRLSSVAN